MSFQVLLHFLDPYLCDPKENSNLIFEDTSWLRHLEAKTESCGRIFAIS